MSNKKTHFVFFHVGNDISMPNAMVQSITRTNQNAEIIHVTSSETPSIEGTIRFDTVGDKNHLMLWRTVAFSQLELRESAIYLDTDMIVKKPIDIDILGKYNLALCRRSFNRNAIFNPVQRGQDYSEHKGMSLDEVYPYVGCVSIARNSNVWEPIAAMYQNLSEKFKIWYGDQEVLREYAKSYKVIDLDEKLYACLPEYYEENKNACIIHYKGARKSLMIA